MCYKVVKTPFRSQEIGVIQDFCQGSKDVARICPNNEIILYADDNVLVYSGTTLEEHTDHAYFFGATVTSYH